MASPEHAEGLDAARLAKVDGFVNATRTAVFVRRADRLLLIRPEKTLGVNDTAAAIIEALYGRDRRSAGEVLAALAPKLGAEPARLLADAEKLLEAIGAMMREDFSARPLVRFVDFDRKRIQFPVLAEIAVTYACQNRCAFCYAASPYREGEHRVMTAGEVKTVMDKIMNEAHVPSLSFTGGEATLRPDLPELVRHGADLGLRVNLITNGVRPGDLDYAKTLVDAGLASAQVSIEATEAGLHDLLVGRKGSFEATIAGVRNFRKLGIHVHTNSTLCKANLDRAADLIRFVARDLNLPTLSMNMLIRTGTALTPPTEPVTYTEICRKLPELVEVAKAEGLRFVWYSPIPYCLVNPVLIGQGAKSCSCVSGILSVDPAGNVLPCSSFGQGIGSLLSHSYAEILDGPAARYWSQREYVPPVCQGCADVDVCAGACPLYWDAAGSFQEIPRAGAGDPAARGAWEAQRRQGQSFGVKAPGACARREPGARAGREGGR
ncbi:MAG TPA: radical SAM protein [Myxococcales bacterium]